MTILQRYLYLSLDTIKSPQSWREKDGRALARRDTASPQPDKTHTLSSKTQARKLGTSFIMKYNTFQVNHEIRIRIEEKLACPKFNWNREICWIFLIDRNGKWFFSYAIVLRMEH